MADYKLIFCIFVISLFLWVFQPAAGHAAIVAFESTPSFEGVPVFRQSLFLDPTDWCAKEEIGKPIFNQEML